MEFRNMELVVSAPDKEFWPENNFPEIVLAGRSNVGKSSLINALCGNKKMAYVGNTPGKTRLLNFFNVDDAFYLVDVPGYGFANLSRQLLVLFGKMMEDYFSKREHVKGIVILLDARRKPNDDDKTMIDFARYYGFDVTFVVTKVDKCTKNELNKNLSIICEFCEVMQEDLILFSSKTGKGRDKLIAKIEKLISIK